MSVKVSDERHKGSQKKGKRKIDTIYSKHLPNMGHLTGSVVLVPGSSFPSLSTHQHSPVEP